MKKSLLFVFSIFVFLGNVQCLYAGLFQKTVLAEVNGETIDEDALHKKLETIHRHRPGIRPEGGAGAISISGLVQDLIDERLIIQEAHRAELDKTVDFEKRVDSFVTRQSVVRLRQEVVLDRIYVGEEEVLDYFKTHYEKESKLHERPPDKLKKQIEKRLRKEKRKELSDSFVEQLRKKADVWIDKDLLALLDPEGDYGGEKSVIGRVNGVPIPLNDYLNDVKQAFHRQAEVFRGLKDKVDTQERRNALKAKILDRLITYELVEQEALRRNYTQSPNFADMVEKRKEALLVSEFKAKLVYPLAIPTEEELRQYYNEHINEFKTGYEVRFRHMRFQDRKEAEKILEELKQGADFEFLDARVSKGSRAGRGSAWVRVEILSPAVRKAIPHLEVGKFSDIIADGRQFKIIKLKGRRGGQVIEFSKVVERLKKVVGQKKFQKVLKEYLSMLNKASRIKIHKKALEEIEEQYLKDLPASGESEPETNNLPRRHEDTKSRKKQVSFRVSFLSCFRGLFFCSFAFRPLPYEEV